jgi:hypothetical protein
MLRCFVLAHVNPVNVSVLRGLPVVERNTAAVGADVERAAGVCRGRLYLAQCARK